MSTRQITKEKEQKSLHNELRDRIAEEYRQKGYHVVTERRIGNRRVDVYAENKQEVLVIEVVDTHYSGLLDRRTLSQIKVQIKHKTITICISDQTHEELRKIKGALMVSNGKERSFDDLIMELIKFWKEKKGA